MTAGSDVAPAPRGALRLLVDPVFGGIFLGKLLASAGVWIHSIVAAIVIFDATGSALMVGMVSVAQFAPQLVLSPISGTWADRGHAVRQILAGRVLCVIGSGSLAVWMWAAPDAGDALVTSAVLASSLLVGLGFVVGGPAMQSIVPSLIRPGELQVAMALNTAPMTTARIAGPALGAFVAAHLGPDAAFGIAAATHLVFVLLLLLVRVPDPPAHRAGVDYSVRAALRHVLADRPLVLLLLAVSAIGFGSEPSMTLAPAMADELGGGAGLVGQLSAGFGVGAAIGLVVVSALNRRVRPTTSSSLGLWLLAIGTGLVAVSPSAWLAICCLAVAGLGFSWAMTGVSTLIQDRAPDELRGRIMALWMVGFLGSRPIAAAVAGSAADVTTVRAAFVLTAVVLGVVALLVRPRTLTD